MTVIDHAWLIDQVGRTSTSETDSAAVRDLWALLESWAPGFARTKEGVESSEIIRPRRGLNHDEAASFLRAVSSGLAVVDDAGYVSLPTVRQKTPVGRYALFSRSGTAMSINLEYLIQVGATAELVLDHRWPADRVGFERGEFDAVCFDRLDRVVFAMEAKARVTGPDSLESLVRSWLSFHANPDADLANNAGRKWRELRSFCQSGPVLVWLVADGARWELTAELDGGAPRLTPGWATMEVQGAMMRELQSYDAAFRGAQTLAGRGGCSWHGESTCDREPVISFRDGHGHRQSGCQRAVDELTARGEI